MQQTAKFLGFRLSANCIALKSTSGEAVAAPEIFTVLWMLLVLGTPHSGEGEVGAVGMIFILPQQE